MIRRHFRDLRRRVDRLEDRFTIPFTSNVIYAIDSRSNDFGKTHSMYGKPRVRPPERESMRAFAAQHD